MAWLALGSAWAGAPTSRPWPRLDVPVDCPMGTVCVVQTYVDHAPGPLARDHTCGPLATDGHRGIDIRVPGRRHMTAGVAVVAAAPGLVRTALDGAPDRPSRATLDGDAAGNTVVLDHGGGWVTQYSHLRRGSVAVRPGQRVAAGARLGLIGLSGRTDFPHLHFAVRHGGAALDPFTGRAPEQGCGLAGATPLWSAAARRALAYRAGGLLAAGFATARPTLANTLGSPRRARPPGAAAPRLIFWAAAWGLRAGDREVIRLIGPKGAVLAERTGQVPGDRAEWLRYVGRARAGATWPAGRYRGEYRVERPAHGQTETVIDTVAETQIP